MELLEDERPPEEIWLDDEALAAHFEHVDQQRKAGSNAEAVPEGDLQRNELTADFIK